ncbi:MAG: trpA [Caulobacteraceae bacterium]|nr:trpA [Caulobacteraceae bacterium]
MTNRIPARFAELAAQRRAGLVTYVMAGDPDPARALAILKGLPAAGADLIELGFPFSDPMAEGPPIQRAAGRALAAGMTLNGTLDLVRAFRAVDQATPVILMGYMNPLLTHGLQAFARDAASAGVDGLIVVDCPPEEADPLVDALDAVGVSLIRLATPTTDDRRLPVAVGFGIKTPQRAAEVARVADACVVGSALVDAVQDAIAQNRDPVSKVLETVESLAKAVRSARVEGSIQA